MLRKISSGFSNFTHVTQNSILFFPIHEIYLKRKLPNDNKELHQFFKLNQRKYLLPRSLPMYMKHSKHSTNRIFRTTPIKITKRQLLISITKSRHNKVKNIATYTRGERREKCILKRRVSFPVGPAEAKKLNSLHWNRRPAAKLWDISAIERAVP